MNPSDSMPRRITINLPDTVGDNLKQWADNRGQAIATAAAVAIELAMLAAMERGEINPKGKTNEGGE